MSRATGMPRNWEDQIMRYLDIRLPVRLLASAGVAALMASGPPVSAWAADSSGAHSSHQGMQGRYCRDFVSHLSRDLNLSSEKVSAAAAQAARQTVDDAVRNGDLTRSQADQLNKRFAGQNVCPTGPAATPSPSPTPTGQSGSGGQSS